MSKKWYHFWIWTPWGTVGAVANIQMPFLWPNATQTLPTVLWKCAVKVRSVSGLLSVRRACEPCKTNRTPFPKMPWELERESRLLKVTWKLVSARNSPQAENAKNNKSVIKKQSPPKLQARKLSQLLNLLLQLRVTCKNTHYFEFLRPLGLYQHIMTVCYICQ